MFPRHSGIFILALLITGCSFTSCQGTQGSGLDPEPERCTDAEGEFEKPDEGSGERTFLTDNPSEVSEEWDSGAWYFVYPRPHLKSNSDGRQSWLHEGEHFVADISEYTYNLGETRATMRVLLNFEPVPFRMIEVDSEDEYKPVEDLDLSPSKLTMKRDIVLRDREPLNYTLAVPASSFQEGLGAYDLRVVFIPKPTPSTDKGMHQLDFGLDGFAYRVYYEGCQNVAEPPDKAETKAITWTRLAKEMSFFANDMFLAPPTTSYDWQSLNHPRERAFKGVLEVPNDGKLTLYPTMSGQQEDIGLKRDWVYVVFRNNELVDAFEMQPPLVKNPTGEYFKEEESIETMQFPLRTSENGQTHYTVMAFSNPYAVPTQSLTHQVVSSNTLIFEPSP